MKHRRRTAFIFLIWLAFVLRGVFQSVVAPMWEGFDEPFHLAYVAFVAEQGRVPGYHEKSLPAHYLEANRHLPSFIGYGAPEYDEWRAMTAAARAEARRKATAVSTLERSDRMRYVGENYERQQGPLYYLVAAPFARLFLDRPLPLLLVAMRIFSVLLASLMIPLTAVLARLLLPPKGLLVALPIAALLPNTPFFAFRVSNEALTWPLAAAVLVFAVLAARRPTARRFLILGLLTALGIWTKLTLLPALPAALAAVLVARRRSDGRALGWRPLLLGVVVPLLLTLPLFVWNHIETGSWSGMIETAATSQPGIGDYMRAIGAVRYGEVVPQIARTHLWSGGWGFVQPAAATYRIALLLILLLLIAAVALAALRRPRIDAARFAPLAVFAIFFAAAMFAHVLSFAHAARIDPRFAGIGGEGWYVDLLRPVEAVVAGGLLLFAFGARSTAPLLIALLAVIDAIATHTLMLEEWSGMADGGTVSVFAAAVEAAPLAISPLLPVAIAAGWVAALAAAAAVARR